MEKLSWLHKRLVRSVVKKMLNRADEVGPHRRVIYGHIVERNSAQRIK